MPRHPLALACLLVGMLRLEAPAEAAFVPAPAPALARRGDGLWAWPRTIRVFRPSARIDDIDQGRDGLLWLATPDGLFRFDGVQFRRWDILSRPALAQNPVSRVRVFGNGDVWMILGNGEPNPGTDDPDVRVAGRAARFRAGEVTIFDGSAGLPDGNANALAEGPDGAAWIATTQGVVSLREGRFTKAVALGSLADECFRALARDDGGALWLGGSKGVWRFDGRQASPVTAEPVTSLRATGAVVVATGPRGVARFESAPDGVRSTWTLVGEPAHLAAADGARTTWIADRSGLVREGGERHGLDRGLPDTQIDALFVDREHNVWVGTRKGGLALVSVPLVHNVGRAEGLADDVARAVLETRGGAIMVATPRGVTRLVPAGDGWRFETLTTPFDDPTREPGSLVESAGGIVWVATRAGGLLSLDPDGVVARAPTTRSDPRHLLIDRDGALWVAWASGAVDRFTAVPGGFDFAHPRPLPERPAACAGAIAAMTLRSDDTVALLVDRGAVVSVRKDALSCDTLGADLHGLQATSLLEDRSRSLWAGTRLDLGLLRLEPPPRVWFRSRAGLPCDSIHELVMDDHGHLWTTCIGGVARIDAAALPPDGVHPRARGLALPANHGVYDPVHLAYNRHDHVRSEQTSFGHHPAAIWTRAGDLWVATLLGVTVIDDPVARARELPLPTVTIEAVSVDGHEQASDDVRVKADDGILDVSLLVPTFLAPERVRLRHRIDDEPWVDDDDAPSASRMVRLPGTRAGRHRLTIVARDAVGRFTAPITLRFAAVPPLHRSPSFLVLCAGAVAFLGFAAYRMRLRRIAARYALLEEERARIARDLHDGLAQGFASVGLHLDVLEQRAETPANRELTVRARALLDHTRDTAKDAVWNLRRETRGADSLAAALAAAIDELAPPSGRPRIELITTGDVSPSTGPRAGGILHEVPFIVRESLTNVLRHAEARHAWVHLRVDGPSLEVRIEDDGRGLPAAAGDLAASGHFGVLGMRERARRLGGALSIDPRPEGGVAVTLRVPIEVP